LSLEEHHRSAPPSLTVQVITLSDTRDAATDTSGAAIRSALEEAGHRVRGPHIVREDAATMESELGRLILEPGVDAVIVHGGTGIAPRDRAPDVLQRLYDRALPGFGELFRMLSFEEIGAAAMLSRASAGVVGDRMVFSLPGSRAAVRLALERLVLPELAHCVRELRRFPPREEPR